MPEISMAQTEDFNWHGWFQLSFGEVGAEGEGGGERKERESERQIALNESLLDNIMSEPSITAEKTVYEYWIVFKKSYIYIYVCMFLKTTDKWLASNKPKSLETYGIQFAY